MNNKFRIFLAFVLVIWLSVITTFSNLSADASAPTPTPKPKPNAIFSPKSYNKKKPTGILAILNWFLGGGGGPWLLCKGGDRPTLQFENLDMRNFYDAFELMDSIMILSCNWTRGERLELSIKYPNGKTINKKLTVLDWNGVFFDFRPSLTDPTGIYQVAIKGNSTSVNNSISIIQPFGIDVYWLGNKNLLLQGFSPSETIQVVAYDSSRRFQGWQEYQVGRDGSLLLYIDSPVHSNILVTSPRQGIDLVIRDIPLRGMTKAVENCTHALPTRMKAQSSAAAIDNITYYSLPNSKSKVIKKMQPQSRHYVLEGPWCVEGKWWWKMQSKKNFSGYVVESDQSNYYLLPVNE